MVAITANNSSLFFHECRVSLVNDLAVVKMSGGPVRFTTTIRAACLPFDYVNVRDATSLQPQPYITGWGALDDGQRSTTILRQVGRC